LFTNLDTVNPKEKRRSDSNLLKPVVQLKHQNTVGNSFGVNERPSSAVVVSGSAVTTTTTQQQQQQAVGNTNNNTGTINTNINTNSLRPKLHHTSGLPNQMNLSPHHMSLAPALSSNTTLNGFVCLFLFKKNHSFDFNV
jgi:hypothetical protein